MMEFITVAKSIIFICIICYVLYKKFVKNINPPMNFCVGVMFIGLIGLIIQIPFNPHPHMFDVAENMMVVYVISWFIVFNYNTRKAHAHIERLVSYMRGFGDTH